MNLQPIRFLRGCVMRCWTMCEAQMSIPLVGTIAGISHRGNSMQFLRMGGEMKSIFYILGCSMMFVLGFVFGNC